MKKKLIIFSVLFLIYSSHPVPVYAQSPVRTDFLNPDVLYKILKENVSIPLPEHREGPIVLPAPEQALQNASSSLRHFNKGVREKTGINLGKFIAWFAKILKVFFQIIVDFLDIVARSLE